MWPALQSGDGDGDGGAGMEALSEGSVGVYPTGFADRADHVGLVVVVTT